MRGLNLKAISGVWPPYVTKIMNDAFELPEDKLGLDGSYIGIWLALSQKLNFSTSVTKLPTDAKWSSMRDHVSTRKYDLILTGNSLTQSRSVDFDFSVALTPSFVRYNKHFLIECNQTCQFFI